VTDGHRRNAALESARRPGHSLERDQPCRLFEQRANVVC
jgi:hypothetical protein